MKQQKLISARKEKGLTQKQMADRFGITQTNYSKKERGMSSIKDPEWSRFAKILNTSIAAIKQDGLSNEGTTDEIMVSVPEKVYKAIVRHNLNLKKENKTLKKQLKQKP